MNPTDRTLRDVESDLSALYAERCRLETAAAAEAACDLLETVGSTWTYRSSNGDGEHGVAYRKVLDVIRMGFRIYVLAEQHEIRADGQALIESVMALCHKDTAGRRVAPFIDGWSPFDPLLYAAARLRTLQQIESPDMARERIIERGY